MSPIVYDKIIVECRWWVIFWAAEHGYTSILQRIKAAEQRYRAAANADDFTAAGLPIDWSRELPGILFEFLSHDFITWPRKDFEGQKPRRGPRWLVTGRGCAPLHLAVLNGHLDTIKFLLDNGADIEAVSGFVFLQTSSYPNWDPASSEEKKQKLCRLIQVLVQSGRISVNTTDYLGVTPLSRAVATSNAPAIEALLSSGADPDL
ncbi:palmitoyltransferase AKR1 [Apiospora arundinis]